MGDDGHTLKQSQSVAVTPFSSGMEVIQSVQIEIPMKTGTIHFLHPDSLHGSPQLLHSEHLLVCVCACYSGSGLLWHHMNRFLFLINEG